MEFETCGKVGFRVVCRSAECLAQGPLKRDQIEAVTLWNSVAIAANEPIDAE